MKDIAVIGAGLVGSLQALFLEKRGFRVHLFDKRPNVLDQEISHAQGRSINLALSARGLRALKALDLDVLALKQAMPMCGRYIHKLDGSSDFQPYSQDGQAIYAISRNQLNHLLLAEAAKKQNIQTYFEHTCREVVCSEGIIHFELADKARASYKFDHIFAVDGAFSNTRKSLMKELHVNYSQEYLSHGYKELLIPAYVAKTWKKDALHIWARQQFMLIALPNLDGSFTATLFLAHQGAESFDALQDEDAVKAFFSQYFPDVLQAFPQVVELFLAQALGYLITIKTSPWNYADKLLLLGDAAHAIVPFYGQGMNAGFEDCLLLDEFLQKDADWAKVFADFSQQRKKDTDAIAELALLNYEEMRSKTADPSFVLQKRIEAELANRFPEIWKSVYAQVSFQDVPYSEALNNFTLQENLMQKVMQIENIENFFTSETFANRVIDEIFDWIGKKK